MTTQTTTEAPAPVAYPAPVAALLPKARLLAADLGELPSRNRLMTELRIGAPKARVILAALTAPDDKPTGRLHLVPATVTNGTDVDPAPAPGADTETEPDTSASAAVASEHVAPVVDPGTATAPATPAVRRRPVRSWPVLLLAAPAFISIWSGWVGLGGLTGFGIVHPLPGIADGFSINTAITLPIGVETYAAFALRAWLSGTVPPAARRFAKWSAIGSLVLGGLGQVAYHLMSAAGMTAAPWWITTLVACLPVAVLGMGAALAHLLHNDDTDR